MKKSLKSLTLYMLGSNLTPKVLTHTANVIEKILNAYEKVAPVGNRNHLPSNTMAKSATDLEILYFSGSKKITEEKFKRELLDQKESNVKLCYTNETQKIKEWNASRRFNKKSSVENNLRSGYLREWRKKGIYKAELRVKYEMIDCATHSGVITQGRK